MTLPSDTTVVRAARTARKRAAVFLWVCLVIATAPTAAQTRAATVADAQAEKAARLQTETPNALERFVTRIETSGLSERVREGLGGFHPKVGGITPAGGVGLGLGYRFLFRNGSRVESGYVGSLRGYHLVTAGAGRPLGDRVDLRAGLRYRRFTQERFFGVGLGSRREDRTHFGLEDLQLTLGLDLVPIEPVRLGVETGTLGVGIAPGTGSFPSIETRFTPADAPGLSEQPDFWFARAAAEVDYRDVPANPRAGGRHRAEWSWYRDRDLGRYDFRQLAVETELYVPFFHQRRVIALRARAVLADTADGRQVPFYLMPLLGGPESLRGFREHRFRDTNVFLLNAEYRWEVFAALDMALFVDAGHAATTRQQLRLRAIETAYGVGFRLSTREQFVTRLDIGRGAEGTRVYLRFRPVF